MPQRNLVIDPEAIPMDLTADENAEMEKLSQLIYGSPKAIVVDR